MKAVFQYAWRNLWRNKRRTGITLTAVVLTTAILVVSFALMDGMIVHLLDAATNMVVGEAKVHAEGYREDRSFFKSIDNPEAILNKAREQGIEAAPRSYGYGLVSVGTKSSGAIFWGIDPAAERKAFDLYQHIQYGKFLTESPTKGIVLGHKLARSLRVSVGTEIIVVIQAGDGSLGNDLFQVTGILKAAGDDIDRGAAILHRKDFEELFVSGGRVHEIALNSRGKLTIEELMQVMAPMAPGLKMSTWRELLPILSDMMNLFGAAVGIFGGIFFLAAGLGVMNTMLMATYDRMREFGILKAIGTTPWRIMGNMAAEALLLGLVATALGLAIGLPVAYILQEVGIDTSVFGGEFSFSGIAWDPIWRATINARVIVIPLVLMWVTCSVASLYPAAVAARIDPVKAIHYI